MRRSIVVTFTILVGTAACVGGQSGGGDDGEEACEGPLGPPISNLSSLDLCCQVEMGEGHCLDAARVPPEIQEYVSTCASGGYCIPDQFLVTGAAVPPATCTAFGGSGVCLSKCIPQVHENAGLLQPDVCTDDQLCVPCISPLDNMPTGACDLLTLATCVGDDPPDQPPAACDDPATCNYEAGCPPVIDPTSLPPCAADAHCVDAAIINGTDPDVAAQLAPCENPAQLCVPDVFIATGGKFTPATCSSVNAAEGRCLSTALPAVAEQIDLLPQDTCAATERCTPCFNPIDGTATGACALACDPGPTSAPMPLAQCCDGRARCVPQDLVPPDDQGNLEQAECEDIEADAYFCVPTEILNNGPFPMCEATSWLIGDYTGVCLSDCLDFGIQGIALDQGNCAGGFTCAPCEQNGEPTGAPGCPP